MKKFLTVLLVIAVMFTFSFSSAFAAALPTADQKASIANEAAKYAEKFDQAATAYMNTLVFNTDDKLMTTSTSLTKAGVVSKEFVQKYVSKAKEAAKDQFAASVSNLYAKSTDWSDTLIITEVGTAYNTAVTENISDGKVFLEANVEAMTDDQVKADKAVALTAIGAFNDTSAYSNTMSEWSFVVKSTTTDLGGKYNAVSITDLASGTSLTAKGFVEAVVKAQTAVVNAVAAKGDFDGNVTEIETIEAAVKTVKDVINGHKITTDENYYIEAVPTIEALKSDTTLASAKTKAIAQMEAVLTSKTIAMEHEIDLAIAAFDKLAKLSDAQQATLTSLKKAKSDFAGNVAAVKEVYTARINNAKTTAEVTGLVRDSANGTLITELGKFGSTTDGLPNADAVKIFGNAQTVCGYVADLKAAADLYAQQKDVNGVAYYDADILKENLADETKKLYALDTTSTTTYSDAEKALLKGFEEVLLGAKIDYINFVAKATRTNLLTPKNSMGQDVTTPWATTSTKAAADAEDITIMASGTNAGGYEKDISDTDLLYDDAQKAELKALVADTEAAIKAATSVAEIETIFAQANDKYEAIVTVNDHKKDWKTGALKTAYDKAEYDKDLFAYVSGFVIKKDMSDYPDAVDTATEIMDKVVYPIVYKAYTADELAAKVAEAKQAVDNMLTSDQVAAQKKATEALIAAIPAKVALDSKDAIVAAANAADAFAKVPGAGTLLNKPLLDSAIGDYEDLLAKQLDDSYKVLNAKTITPADADAVAALRTLYDEYDGFCSDYGATQGANTDNGDVEAIEAKLVAAQVAAAKAMMIQLPANPTTANRAQVEAARAAFDALPLAQQKLLMGTLPYQNLLDAEEALGISIGNSVKELKLTAGSSAKKGSITVKWTVVGDTATTDGYQIWKSTKKNKGFKKAFTTTKTTYKNTKGLKAGTRYYYKVRAYQVVDGKNVYSDWSNKAIRIAK